MTGNSDIGRPGGGGCGAGLNISGFGGGGGFGVLSDDDSDDLSAPRRRSNSVPVPKIEVTVFNDDDEHDVDKAAVATQGSTGGGYGGGYGLNAESRGESSGGFHTRARSLGGKGSGGESTGGGRRKKSIIGQGLDVTKLKHFKSFVESKIMSKSDRNLYGDDSDGEGGLVVDDDYQFNPSAKRRGSRASFSELEVNLRTTSMFPSMYVRTVRSKIRFPSAAFMILALETMCSNMFPRKINEAREEGICTVQWNL